MRKREFLSKRLLASALGVSERSLTTWQAQGMPIAEIAPSRGATSHYDLDEVRQWMRQTGKGLHLRINGRAGANVATSTAATQGLDEQSNTNPASDRTAANLLRARWSSPASDESWSPDPESMRAISRAFAARLARMAALMVRGLDLTSGQALAAAVIVLGELCNAIEEEYGFDSGPSGGGVDVAAFEDGDPYGALREKIRDVVDVLSQSEIDVYLLDFETGRQMAELLPLSAAEAVE